MGRLIAAALALACPAAAAAQDPDLDRLMGGTQGELRAALQLTEDQCDKVRKLYVTLGEKLADLRKAAKAKGVDAARDDFRKLQGDAVGEMKKILAGRQVEAYAELLKRKDDLAGEYEKALFGIPPVTEMKIKLGLPPEDCRIMQKVADDGVDRIRQKIVELKDKKHLPSQITEAVNELRKECITKMVEACSKPSQKKVKEHIRWYLGEVEAKLSKPDVDRLSRTANALAIKDEDARKDVRRRIAAVLMHKAEIAWGTKSLVREVVMLMVGGAKAEGNIWERMSEYGTLNDIHRRRLRDLQDDLKQILGGKEIGRLVSEGIVEE